MLCDLSLCHIGSFLFLSIIPTRCYNVLRVVFCVFVLVCRASM